MTTPFTEDNATLYAKTPFSSYVNYAIKLKTPAGTHLKTISGSTTTGEIYENWNLTLDDNSTQFDGESVNAEFQVTPLTPSGTPGIKIGRAHV